MNIAFEIALVVLLVAVLFGGSYLLGKIGPNSFKGLSIKLTAGTILIILAITESNSMTWPMVAIVTGISARNIMLYYRARTEPLENQEVA